LRWLAISGQVVIVALAVLGLKVSLPLLVIAALISVTVLTNLGLTLWLSSREPSAHALIAVLVLDVLTLTGLLLSAGGAANPFSVFYLVHVALAALLLAPQRAWLFAGLTSLAFGSLFVLPSHVIDPHAMHMHHGASAMHLQGMWLAYTLAAGFVVHFVSRVASALQARERELFELQRSAVRHEKLASLSTLGTLKPLPSPGPNGPEQVPVPPAPALASTATKATGKTVDGIGCDTTEQLVYHIHAHLTVFVSGAARQIPAAIGIPGAQAQNTPQGPFIGSGTCFYWLHTHAADGIVHIESPVHRQYTLGNFFNEWGQPLGPGQVGPVKGHVTAIYNGRHYQGNPRNIPLTAHAQIQLEIGQPLIAPESITWPSGL